MRRMKFIEYERGHTLESKNNLGGPATLLFVTVRKTTKKPSLA